MVLKHDYFSNIYDVNISGHNIVRKVQNLPTAMWDADLINKIILILDISFS